MEKAIDKAFDYHPFSQGSLVVVDEWVCGPTFIVRANYRQPQEQQVWSLFKNSRDLPQRVRSIVRWGSASGKPVTIDKSGHPMKQEFKKDKYGADHPMSAKHCTCRYVRFDNGDRLGEMAFPLVALGKKVGAVLYNFHPSNLVYGYDKDNKLVAVFAMRFIRDACLEVEEPDEPPMGVLS